ncbi:MAG TPA: hypothetical protein VI979_02350 [archaeon]|nr:hypothetical protein [archaeon]
MEYRATSLRPIDGYFRLSLGGAATIGMEIYANPSAPLPQLRQEAWDRYLNNLREAGLNVMAKGGQIRHRAATKGTKQRRGDRPSILLGALSMEEVCQSVNMAYWHGSGIQLH